MIGSKQLDSASAKIGGMKSYMLSLDDFKSMMGQPDVRGIFDYLNDHTEYKSVLWDMKGQKVHRGDIERALYKHNVLSLEKLLHYLNEPYKGFMKSYMKKYETEDLKLVIEYIAGRSSLTNIESHILSRDSFSKLDFNELLSQDSLAKLMDKLSDTPYYDILIPYVNHIDLKFSFYVEMVLDRYYFRQLAAAGKKLPDSKNNPVMELIGRNIDLFNLEWIYRAMKFYDMSKEEILNFVLDGGHKYNFFKIKDMVYNLTPSKFRDYFKDSEYGFLFSHGDDTDLYMERRIERYLYYKSLSLYREHVLEFGRIMGFVLLLEFEVKDIISLVECIRYKLSPAETSKYLIRTIEVVE
ncbi:V-type ATPase subunit [Alkalibacter saccharofermentans]|uniref:V/A-type H+-transporting ATPase subunit C n=1 Tax=Alkalibacter saccharofermentans DSM 14828 TaxID=1120975 RepID=A0A1M4X9S3_9FIRM|nr:V-type ATPase subunit [Alkalibacter saccharofermentans]SHE90234.1 V/A-type H+-transporting ATPase subunit C [Alkalibacter saccharofermentans DSM 14828]